MGMKMGEHLFEKADANNDGKVTLAEALKAALLPDNTDPDNDKSLVRVFNGATDAGAVDVYLTGPSDSLTSAVALQANAAVGAVGTFSALTPATLRLWVTAAGDKSKVLLDTSGVVFTKGQVVTIVVTSTAGGVLVNALMLNQEGAIATIANAQARKGWLHARLTVAEPNDRGFGMLGSNVFIANPPHTLHAALQPVMPYLAKQLAQFDGAKSALEKSATG